MREFMEKPIEEVLEMTKEELKDYSGSISEIVAQINDEIDSAEAENHDVPMEGNSVAEAINTDSEAAPADLQRRSRKKKI
jgi:ATPase subunit of ABC transporter with duplicated ATPase domains